MYDGPEHKAGDIIWFDPTANGEKRAQTGAAAVAAARAYADAMAQHFGLETFQGQQKRDELLSWEVIPADYTNPRTYEPEPVREDEPPVVKVAGDSNPPRKASPPQVPPIAGMGPLGMRPPSISDEIAAITAEAAMDEAAAKGGTG